MDNQFNETLIEIGKLRARAERSNDFVKRFILHEKANILEKKLHESTLTNNKEYDKLDKSKKF